MSRSLAQPRLAQRAAELSRPLFGEVRAEANEAAAVLRDALVTASSAELRALERDYRSPRFYRDHGSLELLTPEVWARRRDLAVGPRLAALAIGSVQRNGRVREEACRALAGRPEAVAIGLLLLRFNDPVAAVAQAAADGAAPWQTADRVGAVVPHLPLLEASTGWVRAKALGQAWLAFLDRHEPALLRHRHAVDVRLRGAVLRRVALLRRGRSSIAEILEQALRDRSPPLRRWAALSAADGRVTPQAVRRRLLPLLWADRNPRIREIALRHFVRGDDAEAHLRRAAVDPNAGVRFFARRFAQRLGLPGDYRQRARRILEAGADRRALVGALGLLSDGGSAADLPLVRRFLEHPVRSVRDEARRTHDVLSR